MFMMMMMMMTSSVTLNQIQWARIGLTTEINYGNSSVSKQL